MNGKAGQSCLKLKLAGKSFRLPVYRRSRIFTCGINNVDFWVGHQEKNVYHRKMGLFGYRFKRQTMLCVCPVPSVAGKIITGSILGKFMFGMEKCALH